MPEAGARRPLPSFLSPGRHPQRWLLTAFLGCELAALLWLLWRAGQGWAAGERAPLWWAALAVAATLWGGRAWQGAWRAAACRLVGIATGDAKTEIVVAVPKGGHVRARVAACWQLGGLATVLRLTPAQDGDGAVPGVLVIVGCCIAGERDKADGAPQRAILRALHAS
ncbi:hypothetical protein J5T34_10480 [Cupriavidus gilardii]|uniref:hypothetical protein n=1 Tax=Cupriavidus gilardii TaxID=82541 RepID=UPI001ABE3F66|nr:hypothetical protein [Cupriavidus gilardii]MBO4121147.1 hypothetical protein [Cupriavidus gilardii]